VNTHKTDIL